MTGVHCPISHFPVGETSPPVILIDRSRLVWVDTRLEYYSDGVNSERGTKKRTVQFPWIQTQLVEVA